MLASVRPDIKGGEFKTGLEEAGYRAVPSHGGFAKYRPRHNRRAMVKFISRAFWLVLFSLPLTAELAIPPKHELDNTLYRRLVLDNGLKVLLVSDPDFNQSAASLDVAVGSLEDPRELQGQAHFLEHMLFLGTEKYPDVASYSSFISARGGYNNAFTGDEHTNYHFQIHHDAFEEALDRFAQFFIAPLMSPEFIERERNAVHSEHQKNLQNDEWRLYQLMTLFLREGHPARHFGTGSLATLKSADRAAMMGFYERHYSADRMALALLGRANLDALEVMARRCFSPVKNRKLGPLRHPPDYLARMETVRLIRMTPVKDLRELRLEFSLPALDPHFRSKPGEFISFCLGHEGAGSLLSKLKGEGLATDLSAAASADTPDYGSLSVNVHITPAGLERYSRVLTLVFSYIALMKEQGFQGHIFSEMKTSKRLAEVFNDRGEGTGRAVALASDMNRYPLDIVENLPFILEKPDPELYKKFLGELRPDNMLVLLTAPGLLADQVEPIYGTRYSAATDADLYRALLSAKPEPGLSLPAPNSYMPRSVDVHGDRPILIAAEPGFKLWYAQDVQFKRPHVDLRFRVRLPREFPSLRNLMLMQFYCSCLQEQLRETIYTAGQGGLGFSISGGVEGLDIGFSGYSDRLPEYIESMAGQLREVRLDERRFSDIRDRHVMDLRNFRKEAAWMIARALSRKLRREVEFTPEEQLPVAEALRLEDVREFARRLYRAFHLEGLVLGDVDQTWAKSAARSLLEALSAPSREAGRHREGPASKLELGETFQQRYLQLGREPMEYTRGLETNNSCLYRFYALDVDGPSARVAARILDNFIYQPFFTEMRTQQQLGYLVFAAANEDRDHWNLYFVIQSANYPAHVLAAKADPFIASLPAKLAAISAEDFTDLKRAVEESLKEKPKSVGDRASRMQDVIFNRAGDFDREEDEKRALQKLTQQDLLRLLTQALAPATQRRAQILLYAKDHAPAKSSTEVGLEELRGKSAYR